MEHPFLGKEPIFCRPEVIQMYRAVVVVVFVIALGSLAHIFMMLGQCGRCCYKCVITRV